MRLEAEPEQPAVFQADIFKPIRYDKTIKRRRHDFLGTIEKMTPALQTNYEIYKSVAHTLLAVTVLITPYLSNPKATAWHQPVSQYVAKIDETVQAIQNSTDAKLNKVRTIYFLVLNTGWNCFNFLKISSKSGCCKVKFDPSK